VCYSEGRVGWIGRMLAMGRTPRKCDAIFVLAGARERKVYGLQLYGEGLATRILLSVGRFEIRRFRELPLPYPAGVTPINLLAAAQPIPPPERHFFVACDGGGVSFERVPAGRLGTLREIRALANWCGQRPEVQSLVIVSSRFHLRRVRMCCRAVLPKELWITYAASPEEGNAANGGEDEPRTRTLALEFLKLAVYRMVLLRFRVQGMMAG